MLARVRTAALWGLDAFPVDCEVDVGPGLPGFVMVGLPDATAREARERVWPALRNAGLAPPDRRVTVSLAPADRRMSLDSDLVDPGRQWSRRKRELNGSSPGAPGCYEGSQYPTPMEIEGSHLHSSPTPSTAAA